MLIRTALLKNAKPLFFRNYTRPTLHTQDSSFSEQAWQAAQPYMQAILHHPFIEKVSQGTLDEDVFAHFLIQDQEYLHAYKRANTLIAKRAPPEHQAMLRNTANYTSTVEQHAITYFQKQLQLKTSSRINDATQEYTKVLLHSARFDPFALAFALQLPCYRVFQTVAHHIATHTPIEDNKFKLWYSTYTNERFQISTQNKIHTFDLLAQQQTSAGREAMLAKFLEGMQLECNFFNSLCAADNTPALALQN